MCIFTIKPSLPKLRARRLNNTDIGKLQNQRVISREVYVSLDLQFREVVSHNQQQLYSYLTLLSALQSGGLYQSKQSHNNYSCYATVEDKCYENINAAYKNIIYHTYIQILVALYWLIYGW